MPELPEVETVKKQLNNHLKNKKIISIKINYPRIFENQDIEKISEEIKNETINEIQRKGKWLIYVLDNYYLLSHLRMEGKYLYRKLNDNIEKHELVIFNINNEFELRYRDTRKFGRMYLIKKEDITKPNHLTKLGKEPWDKDLTPSYLKEKFKNKTLPIKSVLLDQSIITGIGNIYADEILFLSKINPHKKAEYLEEKELTSIIDNTKKVLELAIEKGGTTIRTYTSEEGVHGTFQDNLLVHGVKGNCKVCSEKIIIDKIGGRSTYYCPKCQK